MICHEMKPQRFSRRTNDDGRSKNVLGRPRSHRAVKSRLIMPYRRGAGDGRMPSQEILLSKGPGS